jgi:DNA repair protein RadD
VTIAGVQTLVNRLDDALLPPDLVVVDEAHHATRPPPMGSASSRIPADAFVIGLTATPERLDGRGLKTTST